MARIAPTSIVKIATTHIIGCHDQRSAPKAT